MHGSTLFPITESLCPGRLETAQMRMEKKKGDNVKQSSHFKEPNLLSAFLLVHIHQINATNTFYDLDRIYCLVFLLSMMFLLLQRASCYEDGESPQRDLSIYLSVYPPPGAPQRLGQFAIMGYENFPRNSAFSKTSWRCAIAALTILLALTKHA